jgi:hypothetical protein
MGLTATPDTDFMTVLATILEGPCVWNAHRVAGKKGHLQVGSTHCTSGRFWSMMCRGEHALTTLNPLFVSSRTRLISGDVAVDHRNLPYRSTLSFFQSSGAGGQAKDSLQAMCKAYLAATPHEAPFRTTAENARNPDLTRMDEDFEWDGRSNASSFAMSMASASSVEGGLGISRSSILIQWHGANDLIIQHNKLLRLQQFFQPSKNASTVGALALVVSHNPLQLCCLLLLFLASPSPSSQSYHLSIPTNHRPRSSRIGPFQPHSMCDMQIEWRIRCPAVTLSSPRCTLCCPCRGTLLSSALSRL